VVSIGKQTDYAARIVLHLADAGGGGRVTARSIAETRLIPPAFVRRIVSRLSAAGIVDTVRGSGGGITLARPAGDISLRDVVEAMEGPLSLNACVREPHACPFSDECPVREAWCRANQALADHLDGVRFEGLAQRLRVRQGAGTRSRMRKTRPRTQPLARARKGSAADRNR
jgi:Rrf2 family protein